MRCPTLFFLVALCASATVFAGGNRMSREAVSCGEQACSNDYWMYGPTGVLGDETIGWDAPAAGEVVAHYEVFTVGGASPCLTVAAPATSVRVAGTACLAGSDTVRLQVRACNRQFADGSGAVQCSPFGTAVEFLPFACFEGGREVPCYAGARCRIPAARGGCA